MTKLSELAERLEQIAVTANLPQRPTDELPNAAAALREAEALLRECVPYVAAGSDFALVDRAMKLLGDAT
jgi:hypothetical protein